MPVLGFHSLDELICTGGVKTAWSENGWSPHTSPDWLQFLKPVVMCSWILNPTPFSWGTDLRFLLFLIWVLLLLRSWLLLLIITSRPIRKATATSRHPSKTSISHRKNALICNIRKQCCRCEDKTSTPQWWGCDHHAQHAKLGLNICIERKKYRCSSYPNLRILTNPSPTLQTITHKIQLRTLIICCDTAKLILPRSSHNQIFFKRPPTDSCSRLEPGPGSAKYSPPASGGLENWKTPPIIDPASHHP